MNSTLQSRTWGRLPAASRGIRQASSSVSVGTEEQSGDKKEVLGGAFFWLSAFYFVYCARPGELIPGLSAVPLAKISGAMTTLALLFSLGRTPRKLNDLPKEAYYLLLMIWLLFLSAFASPVWKGGGVNTAFDFSKLLVAWVATFLLVSSVRRLRRIVFIQSACVALMSFTAIVKGYKVPRLQDVIGGIYSNPNDMSFAIVLSMPFCLIFLLRARGVHKLFWALGLLSMTEALILTQSRGGFINLVITGTVFLWQVGVKGRRPYLVVAAALLFVAMFFFAGKGLTVRLGGMFSGGSSIQQKSAYESYEQRRELMIKAIHGIARYPLLGVGPGDFEVYSGIWREVHMEYLQIAVEGGIPVLILYLLFFSRGFANLRALGKMKNLDDETVLLAGALKSSLIGFVVGASFAPEAYQFFPYFAVCYTSVLLAIAKERAPFQLPPGLLASRVPPAKTY